MEITKIFLNIDKEQRWLNEMVDSGYRLVKRNLFSYQFEECEKSAYRYLIDQRAFEKDNREFLSFSEDMNMNFVAKQFGLYYFEVDRDEAVEALYTDGKSRIHLYLRCILGLLVIGLLNISIIHGARGPYFCNISIPLVCNSVILGGVLITVVQYFRNIVSILQRRR
ncbi:MAG: DUF2812 domain-containing protein [Hespellia sp.]|nr:DUF2812 domain-containing protein [Hespellia sp.]